MTDQSPAWRSFTLIFLPSPTLRRRWRLGARLKKNTGPQSGKRSLPDFFVETAGGVVLNELRQGRFMKLG